jgi:hypothetical protein
MSEKCQEIFGTRGHGKIAITDQEKILGRKLCDKYKVFIFINTEINKL